MIPRRKEGSSEGNLTDDEDPPKDNGTAVDSDNFSGQICRVSTSAQEGGQAPLKDLLEGLSVSASGASPDLVAQLASLAGSPQASTMWT